MSDPQHRALGASPVPHLARGRHGRATPDADEKRSKWGDVTNLLGALDDITQVATEQTTGADTQAGVASSA
ncbi:hypothetical protein, partial [Streptomyces arenae]